MSVYKVERYCHAGKKNANGYYFEIHSTNKCLADYIGKDLVYVENEYDSNGFALAKAVEAIATVSGFDNEYIYFTDLKEEYVPKINNLVAGLVISVEGNEGYRIYEGVDGIVAFPKKVIEIRVWEKNKKEVTID